MKQLDVNDLSVHVTLGDRTNAGLMQQSFVGGNIAIEKLSAFETD